MFNLSLRGREGFRLVLCMKRFHNFFLVNYLFSDDLKKKKKMLMIILAS